MPIGQDIEQIMIDPYYNKGLYHSSDESSCSSYDNNYEIFSAKAYIEKKIQ